MSPRSSPRPAAARPIPDNGVEEGIRLKAVVIGTLLIVVLAVFVLFSLLRARASAGQVMTAAFVAAVAALGVPLVVLAARARHGYRTGMPCQWVELHRWEKLEVLALLLGIGLLPATVAVMAKISSILSSTLALPFLLRRQYLSSGAPMPAAFLLAIVLHLVIVFRSYAFEHDGSVFMQMMSGGFPFAALAVLYMLAFSRQPRSLAARAELSSSVLRSIAQDTPVLWEAEVTLSSISGTASRELSPSHQPAALTAWKSPASPSARSMSPGHIPFMDAVGLGNHSTSFSPPRSPSHDSFPLGRSDSFGKEELRSSSSKDMRAPSFVPAPVEVRFGTVLAIAIAHADLSVAPVFDRFLALCRSTAHATRGVLLPHQGCVVLAWGVKESHDSPVLSALKTIQDISFKMKAESDLSPFEMHAGLAYGKQHCVSYSTANKVFKVFGSVLPRALTFSNLAAELGCGLLMDEKSAVQANNIIAKPVDLMLLGEEATPVYEFKQLIDNDDDPSNKVRLEWHQMQELRDEALGHNWLSYEAGFQALVAGRLEEAYQAFAVAVGQTPDDPAAARLLKRCEAALQENDSGVALGICTFVEGWEADDEIGSADA